MIARKAVIIAAGRGTRMLTITGATSKAMLPVGGVPVIEIVAREALASGINEIVLVTGPGRSQLFEHLAAFLERPLASPDCEGAGRGCRRVPRAIRVVQREPTGSGSAVLLARGAIGNEPFAVMLPDDIFDNANAPCLRQALDASTRVNAPMVALRKVQPREVRKFGMAEIASSDGRVHRLSAMVEKPELTLAPSNLGIVGRYILMPEIFQFLAETRPGKNGEYQLTDGLMALTRERPVYGVEFEGRHFDVGEPAGYFAAQQSFAHEETTGSLV